MVIYLKLLATAFLWGGTFVSGRLLSGHVPPASAAFLQFLTASLFLVLLTWKTENAIPRIRKHQIIPLLLLGFTGVFCYNILFFKGLERIHAGRAALIIATNPIFISVLSAYFFKEHLNSVQLIGILLSVTGAVTVISRGNFAQIMGQAVGTGELFIFGCVLSWVAFSLIGKTVLTGMSPLVSITCASLVGTAALLVPAAAEGFFYHLFSYAWKDWVNIVYLGLFGTVIGFLWYYEGIRSIGPTKAGLFINFVPVSAIALAYLILDEPVTPSLLVGAFLVSIGVYLTNSSTNKKATSSA